MTTIAVRGGIMACDSRITGGFISKSPRKVIVGSKCIVGFCGGYAAGYAGALFLSGESTDRPETYSDDLEEYIVRSPRGIEVADEQLRVAPISGTFWATGSGGMAAMAAMHMGATALEAVRVAIKCDEVSGSPAKEYRLK